MKTPPEVKGHFLGPTTIPTLKIPNNGMPMTLNAIS
jgi:hypothetical protein